MPFNIAAATDTPSDSTSCMLDVLLVLDAADGESVTDSNQFLLKSKRTRMRTARRSEQYTQGRCRMYVADRKRRRYNGGALDL